MKKRKGLTLIEVVVSIALLGMIAVVFLTIFNTGNKNIIKSGDRTKDVLKIQENVDTQIKSYEDLKLEGVKVEEKDIEVKIDGIDAKTIKGKLITGIEDGIKITTFVPNKVKGD